MKTNISLLLIVSLSLLLSGCGFDESLESNQQHDGDDMNVIQNIWPQALDKMLQSNATSPSSLAQWLDQQSLTADTVSAPLPQVSDQSVVQPSPQLSNQTLPSDVSTTRTISSMWENESDWEND